MADDNRPLKYMRYAIGEIVLVVIGILIALQINNANELRKERAKEVQFLKNLKSDLIFEESELDRFTEIRERMVSSAQIALQHFNGKPIDNLKEFNFHTFNVGVWQEFQRNNNNYHRNQNNQQNSNFNQQNNQYQGGRRYDRQDNRFNQYNSQP